MLTRFPFLGPRSVFPGFKFPPDDHFRDEKLPKDYLSVSYFGPNFRFVKGPTLPFIPAVARANTRLRLHVSPERPAFNGSNNVGLGSQAGSRLTTGSGNVCIGAGILGAAGESNTTRIRNIYSSVASGRAVYIDSNNKIGTLASTRRVKNNIKPMDKASEAVLALQPVSFRYKKEIDASGTLQFGLVAEEVADINADLVTRDSEGKPETVRYDAVNAMLLNEFLKEHREVAELKSTVAEQRKGMEAMAAQLKEQAAQIQKVSAQLEASKTAPQVVNNP